MLDEKDLRIVQILLERGRASYTDIARELGVSDVAVIKRIRKLEQIGVIKGYRAVVDPKKLGYSAVSITGIDVEPEHLFTVINTLKNKEYVKYLALTTGDHSVMMVIWARNGSELGRIHKEISKLDGVKRVCPAIILDVVKDTYSLT